MKSRSVKSLLTLNGALTTGLFVAMAAGSLYAMTDFNQSVQTLNTASKGIQLHMDADSMRNSIRGDVLHAMHASVQAEESTVLEIQGQVATHIDRMMQNLKANADAFQDDELRHQIEVILPIANEFSEAARTVITENAQGIHQTEHFDNFMRQFQTLEGEMTRYTELIEARGAQLKAHSDELMNWAWVGLLSLTLLGLAIIVPSTVAVQRAISAPLRQLVDRMKHIQQSGDLTCRVQVKSSNEIGEAANSFNGLIENIQGIVSGVHQSSVQLLTNSQALAAASQQTLQSAETNSDAAASVASAMEELSASIAHIAQQAQLANEASAASLSLSQSGRSGMNQTGEEIEQISQSVQQSAHTIGELERQVQSISEITGVIRGIAEQTNLLALNAAIEAARAGEEGRGFAVVADEVRNLAERTSESTGKISKMVEAIQQGTRTAVSNMHEGVNRVKTGVDLSQTVVKTIERVEEQAANAAQAVTQISESLREQESAGHDISRTVERVATVSEESHTVAQETARRASELSALAQQLESRVARFKV